MVAKVDTATVHLQGNLVGAVSWLENLGHAVFEYDPRFIEGGSQLSPIHMTHEVARRSDGLFTFPSLSRETFLGLPGLLADSLPDKFGNAVIDAWLARNGRDIATFTPVERLCYMGKRGMGALEFAPATKRSGALEAPVELEELVRLAQEIMVKRAEIDVGVEDGPDALREILRVGTSAGGARPKAIIAMNDQGHILSGQGDPKAGYEYWLLKFDGVTDLELGEPRGYGRIEQAYSLMAKAAGISMTECRLLEEGGRAHFMTRRFDRAEGKKIHTQTLCGLAHYDYNKAGSFSYEQLFSIMRQLHLSKAEAEEQYRRMLFNLIARNQDDHTKNVSFLMSPDGSWSLSPAYDITYSHNPKGLWTNQHQMSLGGKRDHFSREELLAFGKSISMPDSEGTLEQVIEAVSRWPTFAKAAGVSSSITKEISKFHRLELRR
jgi:serine/threonine-protein kinase HipA